MSVKTHNKKRNAGLLYEFLVRMISSALVDGDKKKSSVALKVLKRHFKQGTELYKEFRLINALMKTSVSSEHVASSILSEAKIAARAYDVVALDKEKSVLIKQINHHINDANFYDQHVNEYTMYATVQTLLNDWRSNDKDLMRVAEFEDKLMKRLTAEKVITEDQHMIDETPGTARLLMKVMTQRLNEKYSQSLSDSQKSLLKAYVFSTATADVGIIEKRLADIREAVLKNINEYSSTNASNEFLLEKLSSTKEKILSENIHSVDDDLVTRFMLYTKLNSELVDGGYVDE